MHDLIQYKALTPSLRFKCLVNKSFLWSGKKILKLRTRIKNYTGRSKKGHLILYTRSKNYFRKLYRTINFNYFNFGIPFKILRVEYDPNRSAFINLIWFSNDLIGYYLALRNQSIEALKCSYIEEPSLSRFSRGTTSILKIVPDNSVISIIENKPLFGAVYTRSAGAYSLLIEKYLNLGKALLKLKSGKLKFVNLENKITIGTISNRVYKQETSGKAGRSRWFGIKPNVRGIAMNPVDHPHGGGQSKKKLPKTPWGKIFKWKKTSRSRFILNRKW